MGFRMIKLSETKWIDESEEYVNSLSKLSAKKVRAVCPRCGRVKSKRWYDVVRQYGTFCRRCANLSRTSDLMLGRKYGRLTVVSYAEPAFIAGHNYTRFNVVCDCGKETVVLGSHLASGHTKSCGCLFLEGLIGSNNPTYNPKLTDEDRKRHRSGINTWRKLVLKRDDYTCQVCGSTESLIAHHLDGYKDNSALATDVDNGVTVCKGCHIDFHINFMGGYRVPVTRQDFEDYLEQV